MKKNLILINDVITVRVRRAHGCTSTDSMYLDAGYSYLEMKRSL